MSKERSSKKDITELVGRVVNVEYETVDGSLRVEDYRRLYVTLVTNEGESLSVTYDYSEEDEHAGELMRSYISDNLNKGKTGVKVRVKRFNPRALVHRGVGAIQFLDNGKV
ncbi:MAG: hypothetical protein AABX12_05100 [Nanoarchaeota archaeon]